MTLVSKFESCYGLILCMSMQSLYQFFYIYIDTNHKNLLLLKINPTFLVSPTPITLQMANRSTEVELFIHCLLGNYKELRDVVL